MQLLPEGRGHPTKIIQGKLEEARSLWTQGAEILTQLDDKLSLERKTRDMLDNCKNAGVEPFDLPN